MTTRDDWYASHRPVPPMQRDLWSQVVETDTRIREAVAARDEAMLRVQERSAPWRTVAYDALRFVVARQTYVSSEDVWTRLDEMGIPRPVEPRAMGPVLMRAVREGLLVPSGYDRGTDPKHHRDILRVYRSVR